MTLLETVKEKLLPSGNGTQLSHEEMAAARLPIQYRDTCAHLLVPLNKCRYDQFYMPWKCEDERHSYEKCQYVEFKKRVAKMEELRKASPNGRSGLN
ncbi:NADH-ubiquinone oxidoreductase B18 subunit-domain-containing protein [Pyronema domesticum]|uniref:NADH dehydrogenase [ubiquinone] 1 beta subcomplex subunit 7 n=1 Tax=Pyronema omphalodes (strain CBS 100304) TaxID=1076935 RepID=U4LX08_PYROM|nr:NADH-ubiquinone oxidoreductase B18 subunit-domain-containing protein [Pyronema domesticum]KAI5814193.1 NADH-ubiquinone oxidoreductase B18 subunit-domain-containing protein [Pyronema omphalodes]CCX34178.1 Similar to NADH dehydrogenase [ubiquinone] 1 beta subcomplex subunit 7; acc. no. Q9SKC9 [Pyronema omphalodes CBS 100304]